MGKHEMNEEPLNGKCSLCGGTYSKAVMRKHLKSCMENPGQHDKDGTRKGNAFHIMVEGAHLPEYWMHLAVNTRTTLEDLDSFLRKTWLECCGHMSEFIIEKIRYITPFDTDSIWEDMGFKSSKERDMNIALAKVLAPGLKFHHRYDFGTTTELVLKVISEFEGVIDRRSIKILARNEPPQIVCNVCGKIATKVCTQCIYEGTGWLCDKCARKHECGEEMLLPVVNSPRVGKCGYVG